MSLGWVEGGKPSNGVPYNIQVGSALAYRGIPLQSAYCAAKHAIQGFNDSLRSELIHDKSNVRVTMVQLPAMNTPQFSWVKSRLPRKPQPVPPIYQPEIGAEAILFLAHNERREMYVGSPTVEAGHSIETENVKIRLQSAPAPTATYAQRIDAEHANPRRLWEEMGQPEYLSAKDVEQLKKTSILAREKQPASYEGGTVSLKTDLPPDALAAITVEFAPESFGA